MLLAQRIQGGRRRHWETRRLCSRVGWWRREARWPLPRVGIWAAHGQMGCTWHGRGTGLEGWVTGTREHWIRERNTNVCRRPSKHNIYYERIHHAINLGTPAICASQIRSRVRLVNNTPPNRQLHSWPIDRCRLSHSLPQIGAQIPLTGVISARMPPTGTISARMPPTGTIGARMLPTGAVSARVPPIL